MKPLIAFLLVAVAAAPQPAQPRPHVQRERVEVAPNSAPQPFTVDCPAGERLLSGGFAGAAPLRITGSHPADGRQAWTVWVHNPARVAHAVEVAALCGPIDSVAVSAPGTSVQCPKGTVATGGGFESRWMPRQGGAAITGSYPVPGTGWGIDIAQLPAAPDVRAAHDVQTFVVCARGLAPAAYQMKNLEVPPGSAAVGCPETLAGGGFQVTTGRLPDYAVVVSMPTGREWSVSVDGRRDDNRPLAVRVTAVCVVLPTLASSSAEPIAVASQDSTAPVIVGVSVAALLLLLLVLVVAMRGRRSRRPAAQPDISVVLRVHRSAFRLGELREVQ